LVSRSSGFFVDFAGNPIGRMLAGMALTLVDQSLEAF
jgi:hypothetical protein